MENAGSYGLTVVATAIIAIGATSFVLTRGDDDGDKTPAPRAPAAESFLLHSKDGAPREFLYLDPARTQAYLSQFQGGLATLEKSSVSESVKLSAELAAGPAKVGGEGQSDDGFERSVTPTTASQFINLAGYLDDRKHMVTLPSLPVLTRTDEEAKADAAEFLTSWKRVPEGLFVRIRARITVPAFVRLYQTMRGAPPESATARRSAKVLAAIGDDPRIPLAIDVDAGSGGPPLRLILPLQYSLLATEPSLLVGGVTVIGKVLYRIHPKRRPYRDLETWNRFRPEVRRGALPDELLDRYNIDRAKLKDQLLRYQTVRGPAAIVLPVAIYK